MSRTLRHLSDPAPDTSGRRIREGSLARLAYLDGLTGLPNRSGFLLWIDRQLDAGGGATLLLCDLRRLKQINDTLGQRVGDALLRSVALRLLSSGLDVQAVARSGGSEFGLLIERSMNVSEAEFEIRSLVEVFQAPVRVPYELNLRHLPVDISVGAASTSGGRDSAEELLNKAGIALEVARKSAGPRCRVYDVEIEEGIRNRRRLNEELRRATDDRQWELFYQPQVNLTDGTLVGVEALIRWRHPVRGLVEPAAFIDVLERHFCAARVGRWVIDEACRQLRAWRDAGIHVPRIAVNLFASQFHSDSLEADILSSLTGHGLQPSDLEIEITEKIAIGAEDKPHRIVRPLAEKGIGIALDDFGTGYASLCTLRNFPVTRLKIDRSFVADLDERPSSNAIVSAIVSLGRHLGMDVIAEGVAEDATRRRLVELGCTQGQGYLVSHPLPADALERWLATSPRPGQARPSQAQSGEAVAGPAGG